MTKKIKLSTLAVAIIFIAAPTVNADPNAKSNFKEELASVGSNVCTFTVDKTANPTTHTIGVIPPASAASGWRYFDGGEQTKWGGDLTCEATVELNNGQIVHEEVELEVDMSYTDLETLSSDMTGLWYACNSAGDTVYSYLGDEAAGGCHVVANNVKADLFAAAIEEYDETVTKVHQIKHCTLSIKAMNPSVGEPSSKKQKYPKTDINCSKTILNP